MYGTIKTGQEKCIDNAHFIQTWNAVSALLFVCLSADEILNGKQLFWKEMVPNCVQFVLF
jgi:hypothetical protein